MNTPITLWSKPNCVQCNMVKKLLIEKFTGRRGLGIEETKAEWQNLISLGIVSEQDLTAEENNKQLEYFKGLGYMSAPITEYKDSAIPGFIPSELDDMVASWKNHNG
ncbi:NrdH-like glutaredoxin [Microbacterium phage YellowPanda]|uniref:NrdH-like glutaredoxin n=2 Tax=Tinytimothyvirus tinytimothy TaxID=2845596 RepID=A0A5Q2WH05_9CAUD|nr:NrdH-like glutaredoxin [Microbacterium phage TinyTimothy]QDF16962.1 NrdH-like glutaredoxin [Microbacterium phage TinyTimothy]QGH78650.1 NrdH-like glutaredoxin [Microbacterium phage Wesak]